MTTRRKSNPERDDGVVAVLPLFEIIDEDVKKLEAENEWEKAREIVEKWKSHFLSFSKGRVRQRCLEELEQRHFLLFWGESIPEEVKILVCRNEGE
jgi:hypothetical protein